MKKSKLIINISTTVVAAVFSVSVNAASVTYDWAGTDGFGEITFFDTNIADPENFSVAFDTENVANISYTFENGNNINDASNFDGTSTLQALDRLGNSMFTATNGVIEDWTFKFISVVTFAPVPIEFFSSSSTGSVACVTAPCPVDTATITFWGNSPNEINSGNWNLQPVPLPAAAWLFIAGIAGVFGFERFSSKAQ